MSESKLWMGVAGAIIVLAGGTLALLAVLGVFDKKQERISIFGEQGCFSIAQMITATGGDKTSMTGSATWTRTRSIDQTAISVGRVKVNFTVKNGAFQSVEIDPTTEIFCHNSDSWSLHWSASGMLVVMSDGGSNFAHWEIEAVPDGETALSETHEINNLDDFIAAKESELGSAKETFDLMKYSTNYTLSDAKKELYGAAGCAAPST